MQLVLPTLKYKQEYLSALKESEREIGETQLNKPAPNQSFKKFVIQLIDFSRGKNLPNGYVPATMYWLIDNDEVIGRVQIRHVLNDYLLNYGGHIGYYIKPSKRRMGYGRKILKLSLIEAKKIGLKKVLLTCDEGNIGSQKIIESCGGVLKNIIKQTSDKPLTRRYWL